MRAVITVVGKDRTGIIAAISQKLSDHKVNIQDISQNVMDEMFAMVMFVDITPCTVPFDALCAELDGVGTEMGMKVHCMHEDIFNAMHRI